MNRAADMPAAAAVLYAVDIRKMAAFYAALAGFAVGQEDGDHVLLESPGFQLAIVRIPDAIARTLAMRDPPARRTDTPIKLVFFVGSIEAARGQAGALGGALDAPGSMWRFQGGAVCDGRDPEGNVFQLRERPRRPG